MPKTLTNVHDFPSRTETSTAWADLLAFNVQLLDQALEIIKAHVMVPGCDFSAYAGPHLRHVIEHFEALLYGDSECIDYDARQRDRAVEQNPEIAAARLKALQDDLHRLPLEASLPALEVKFCGGTAGEYSFKAASTYQRELLFVSSHAVHHFALIRMHCAAQGIALPQPTGKAPSTIAYEAAALKLTN